MIVGDHPQPGVRSLTAAKMIEQVASRVQPEDEAWVLLSGGTTSLIAAPDAALKPDEMMQLFALLHGSGLDIATMNLIRKRFTRWGAGRLAAALRCSKIRNFVISDVIGDDLAAIGSGPCVPDPSTAAQVRSILVAYKIWDSVPTTLRRYLHAVERDPGLETPKAGDAVFENVERKIIASNRTALDAIVTKAKEYGYDPRIMSTTLSGDAASAGRRVASTLTGTCGSATPAVAERAGRSCLIWGGETTVLARHRAARRRRPLPGARARRRARACSDEKRSRLHDPRLRHRRPRRRHRRRRRGREPRDVERHHARWPRSRARSRGTRRVPRARRGRRAAPDRSHGHECHGRGRRRVRPADGGDDEAQDAEHAGTDLGELPPNHRVGQTSLHRFPQGNDMPFSIALIQQPVPTDAKAAVEAAIAKIREARARGAQIICLQELFNRQYFCKVQKGERFELAEPIPGPTVDRMQALAKELGVVLIVPIFERQAPACTATPPR